MNGSRMSKISAWICITMIVGMFGFLADIQEAAAAVTRVAVVKEMKGTVKVKKSGGTKSFSAFKNMSLNEGDAITTGKGASIVLELASSKAAQDEITIGENSQVNFSKLEDKGGTKAKMNVWAGSLWVKVKSISNADDTFEVETPTAIMGVRGTHFFQYVDPVTGKTSIVVASGVVRASSSVAERPNGQTPSPGDEQDYVLVYPSQQLDLESDSEVGDLRTKINIADVDEFVRMASPSIIESMLRAVAEVQQENEQFKKQFSDRLEGGDTDPVNNANLLIRSEEEMNRITANIDNLLANLAKQAADSGKVDPSEIARIIEEVNRGIADDSRKLNLNDVKPLDRTAGVDPDVEAAKREQQARLEEAKRKQEEANRKRQEAQQQQAALIEKIEQQKRQLEEANRKAQEEAAQRAADLLQSRLSDEERARFEEAKRQREQEQRQQEQPAQQQPSTGGGSSGGGSGPSTPQPKVGLTFSDPALANGVTSSDLGMPIVLDVSLDGFGSGRQIYGYQVAVEFDDSYVAFESDAFGSHPDGIANPYRNLATNPFKVELESGWAAPAGYSVDAVDHYYVQENTGQDVLNYAVLKYTGSAVTVSNSVVVKLPFVLNELPPDSGNITFKLTLTPVDASGNVISGASPVTLDLKTTATS